MEIILEFSGFYCTLSSMNSVLYVFYIDFCSGQFQLFAIVKACSWPSPSSGVNMCVSEQPQNWSLFFNCRSFWKVNTTGCLFLEIRFSLNEAFLFTEEILH